jgi:hypothetical protein
MPRFSVKLPSLSESKFLLFWKAFDLKLTCLAGKHMLATQLEQPVFSEGYYPGQIVFQQGEPAEIVVRCVRCNKVTKRERARSFMEALWAKQVPGHYPVGSDDPLNPPH